VKPTATDREQAEKNLDDLFVHTLRDIYYAEKQIIQALPEMINKSSDAQLKQGLKNGSKAAPANRLVAR
jgi:ferritin-like metal-binding protein YciE